MFYFLIFFIEGCQFTEVSIVLDVSGTIYPTFYDQSLSFVTRLLSKMKITSNPNSSRVSVVTFASRSSIRIYCDEYKSIKTLYDAIKKLSYTKDPFTNIKDGLIKAYRALSIRGCGRQKAKRIIVLVTDGKANRGVGGFQAIREKAREIRDTNTTIIAIGVGRKVKYDLLKNLTGGNGNVFTSTTFNDSKLFE